MDEALRRRERNPETTEDLARLLHERLRAGLIDEQLLQASAALHYKPARLLRPIYDVCARCGHDMAKHPVSWKDRSKRSSGSTCMGTALQRSFIEPWWHAIHEALTVDQQVTLGQRLVRAWLEHSRARSSHAEIRLQRVDAYVAEARAHVERGEPGWLWLAERLPIEGATITWLPISVAQHWVAQREHQAGHCSPPTALRILRDYKGGMDRINATGVLYGATLVLRDRNDC